MVSGFERILVSVPDIEIATGEYELLVGTAAFRTELPAVGKVAWFDLGNTVIQLQQGAAPEAAITGLVFSDPAGEGAVGNELGLDLASSDGATLSRHRGRATVPDLRVDHLVLRTRDAGYCIQLFRDRLGIRLALDRTVPEWGGRMLFFRAGKLTLEVIASDSETSSAFWGIAYQCPDLERAVARLESAGVAVSEIRDGRKPGTRVATVRGHCLGIPTLLIEPAT